LDLSGAECFCNPHWTWVQLEGWILFSPISISIDPKTIGNAPLFFPKGDIWCRDLYSEKSISEDQGDLITSQLEFLDWEYIFDPAHFQNMAGGSWNTFRKNVRKWPRDNPQHEYSELPPHKARVQELILDWFSLREEETQDAEIIVNYLLKPHPGIRRKYMYKNGELVGINVWDWNYKYLNYRLCIAKSGERFLDEYMRWSFYVDPGTITANRMVNDGGVLGKEGLERFKDKMNPFLKRKRYSLIKQNKS
jgi:hypothetical protein